MGGWNEWIGDSGTGRDGAGRGGAGWRMESGERERRRRTRGGSVR